MDLLQLGMPGEPDATREFADLRRRAEWILENRVKPALLEDGHYDPLVFVFRGTRFLNAVNLPGDSGRPLPDEVREAIEISEGTSGILARVARHRGLGDALLVALVHPEGRVLLCAPFARSDSIAFGPTQVLEGDQFAGPWADALWRWDG